MATFDSLREACWCTDCNAKKQNSFQWTIFEKMRLDRQKSPKKLNYFFRFVLFFSQNWSCFIGCLNAFMKCHDPQISNQQKLAMWYVPFWRKKMGKTVKKGFFFLPFKRSSCIFFKNGPSKWVLVFLCCNQCVKTLLLSYQTLPSGKFHFSPL